jgi:hypothetical protein
MNGAYHYWMNGTQSDITEAFRITTTDEADTVIESDRHAESFGSQINVVAQYIENQLAHFDIEWQNTNPNAVKFASAHYQFTEKKIIVNRNIDEQTFLETLPAPEVFTVLPLLRVFTGKAIRQTFALGNGGRIPVLVPNIKNPNDNVQLLALELDLRSATKLESETITIADKEHQANLFNFPGGNYDQSAKFWIDENDLLLKYEWQQGDVFWEVKLVEVDT